MIKKFSMIMACIIALILSAVFCTANVIHASGEDLSVSDEAVSEEAAGSQTNGNWPVDITKDDCTIDLSLTYKQDGKTLPLNGGSLALYTVATVKGDSGYDDSRARSTESDSGEGFGGSCFIAGDNADSNGGDQWRYGILYRS